MYRSAMFTESAAESAPHVLFKRFVRSFRTQVQCARTLECSEAWVGQLMSGESIPGLSLAFAIQKHAGIPAEAWLAVKRPRKRAVRRKAA